ncbi:DUF2141 domain-containing protein [Sphingomonas alpina]|uniref:DUF2141 domain-containing protein n=1 Tax=Sphingomonas alpina TaxID=653931 RepID=A0A7H0LGI5_9SPHN|nr:DUF2141 domain-containing protein [Sphingomonas alpina]QNQ08788.1 DUF2141 domain-containing protein [Sphingomonas alpina]
MKSQLAVVLTALGVAAAAFPAIDADAQASVIGSDAAACIAGGGPAIRANIIGLKDRIGELKLELYPATEEDFLKDDRDLIKQGKFFRRVRVATPQSGAVSVCIRAPRPGRYALLFTHNRDGKNKFDFWSDGAGFPSNQKLGRSRPKLPQAVINVPNGVVTTEIRAQYLRGLGGFAPMKGD